MDKVFIRDLRAETVIGIFEWERRIRQVVSIDLEMGTDAARAAESDDIADAIDYKAVAKRLVQHVEEQEFRLVETLAESIANLVMSEFGVRWLRLSVSKPGALRGARDVGVIIERGGLS